jgi:hypothetical protein
MRMKCSKFEKWISDSLDGELKEKKERELNEHLQSCRSCRLYKAGLLQIQEEASDSERPELQEGYWESSLARLRMKVEEGAKEPKRQGFFSFGRRWAWIGAAAACFLIAVIFIFRPQGQPVQETLTLSFEDSWEQICQEIGDNAQLGDEFNSLILASIVENLGESARDLFPQDDSLFWADLTEEELRFIESEIKKETKL